VGVGVGMIESHINGQSIVVEVLENFSFSEKLAIPFVAQLVELCLCFSQR
jgi:hypothetical protein